ncbi:MAG: hypothetical protein ABIO04_07620 [Ferruginibacter sp.]
MKLITKIRLLTWLFIIALVLSGVTAMPIESELRWLLQYRNALPKNISDWLQQCYSAISDTNNKYPYLAYGYDWLAFAHIVIALSFIGLLKDPVKNIWIIEWQILCCIAVLPLAIIAGPIRHIPNFHIAVDCSFGLLGLIPLLICRRWIKKLSIEKPSH